MKPQFVPVILGGRRGTTPFTPARLFTSGVAGAWYDPSDYSTLFQDSAGTTPVTAVEQPVGLMLDKSQGLVLGSELVTNGDFSGGTTGWTNSSTGTGTFSVSSGVASIAGTDASNRGVFGQAFTTVVGRAYVLTFTASSVSGATLYGASTGAGYSFSLGGGAITAGSIRFQFVATTTTTYVNFAAAVSTAGAASIDNVSVKDLIGNHARQATPTSCPVLRARYNQLTYSEQFDNAAWSITGVTRSNNTQTAPDGTVTAETITGSSSTNAVLFTTSAYTALAGNLTLSWYIKAGTADYAVLSLWSGSSTNGVNLWVNVQTGAVGSNSATAGYTFVSGSSTAVGNGWYRVVLTGTVPAGSVYFSLRLVDGDNAFSYTNTVGKTLFVWGADLRTGSSAGTYQRIAAATDYATAGFLPYLYFVTDDSFGTNSIDFSATDKLAVVAGSTKLGTSASILAELSANTALNPGSFYIGPNVDGSTSYTFALQGTAGCSYAATTYSAPVTNTISVQYDIAGSGIANEIVPKINGATPTLVATGANAGTGNFGNYPLYIGRRNNATLPFEGRVYQLVVVGKTLSASELASTEAYVNSKTGAY